MNRNTQFLLIFALALLIPLACDTGTSSTKFPTEADVEARSFDLTNQERTARGLSALTLNSQLSSVARAHSRDMRERNFFAHTDPAGHTPSDRIRDAGISFRVSGENIALTRELSDPAGSANSLFLQDQEHRANLLNSRFTQVGVGVIRSGNEYWITQDFIGQ